MLSHFHSTHGGMSDNGGRVCWYPEGQTCPEITDPLPLRTNAESDGGFDGSPQVTTDGDILLTL